MNIHAPERPIHSLKDFGIHIAVVTVGILIALSLEGLREIVYDHQLVRETHENVRQEMTNDRDHAALEYKRIVVYRDELHQLVQAMPALEQQHPGEAAAALDKINNPGYLLSSNSWTAALSTGVLAHMPASEVEAFAYAAEGMTEYRELQKAAHLQEEHTKAYFSTHPTMNADQISEATERLTLLYQAEDDMVYFCSQMQEDIERALEKLH
jgi:ribosomal protein L18